MNESTRANDLLKDRVLLEEVQHGLGWASAFGDPGFGLLCVNADRFACGGDGIHEAQHLDGLTCRDTVIFADDNVVEALEWKNKTGKPFLLSVQWHPERMFEFQLEKSALSAGIRNVFIEAIKKSK